jgi:hypothetical protein
VIIVSKTSSCKQHLDGRFFDRCEAHNAEVAAGDIFATLNSSQPLEITKDKKGTFPI